MDATQPALTIDTELLTFEALHSALTRCMAAHPPSDTEHRMHPDANTIAGLWGAMSYERREAVPVDEVDPKVMTAYLRWGPEFGKGLSE